MPSSTWRYDVSFEMRLSESKYPPGSESRWTSFANDESTCAVGAATSDEAYAARGDVSSCEPVANHPKTAATGAAASSHRAVRNLALIDNLRSREDTWRVAVAASHRWADSSAAAPEPAIPNPFPPRRAAL